MNLYRQTAKRLDIFLNREQRLVYTLCREVISDVILAQRTQLALDLVQGILAELQEKGLIEQVAGSQPAALHEEALSLEASKAQLMAALEAVLGSQAHKYQQELAAKQNLAELEEWGHKLVLKLRLTVSQKAAQSLEAKLKALFPP